MRDWFVGILFAVAGFLYLYKGYSQLENLLLHTGAVPEALPEPHVLRRELCDWLFAAYWAVKSRELSLTQAETMALEKRVANEPGLGVIET